MEQDFGENIIVTINVFNSCNCFVPVSGQLFVANVKMIASRLDEVKLRAPNVSKTRLFIVEQFYFPVRINFFLSLGAMALYPGHCIRFVRCLDFRGLGPVSRKAR